MSIEAKNNILLIATELFSSHGYDSVGVNDIVLKCKITKPTLYHYFGSKENLLKTIIKTNIESLIDRISECSVRNSKFPNTLKAAADCYLQFAKNNGPFLRLYLSLIFTPHSNKAYKIVKTWAEKIQYAFESIFESETLFNNGKSFFAAGFIGQVNMFSTLILNDYIEYSENLAEKLVDMYLHGAGSITNGIKS